LKKTKYRKLIYWFLLFSIGFHFYWINVVLYFIIMLFQKLVQIPIQNLFSFDKIIFLDFSTAVPVTNALTLLITYICDVISRPTLLNSSRNSMMMII
jgi:hypothetical protein